MAAKQSTEARQKTSDAGTTRPLPATCSGDMKAGLPTMRLVVVSGVAPASRAIPKSIRRGPSEASSTLPGLTSRWTIPAAWTAASAWASPAPSIRTSAPAMAPAPRTAADRVGPATYSVASHGTSASASPSSSGATWGPVTDRATAISRRKRLRKPGSWATSRRTVLTATGSPPPSGAPRKTSPMPPAPSRARIP